MQDWAFDQQETLDDRTILATSGHRNREPEAEANTFIRENQHSIILNGGAEGWDTCVLDACMEYDVGFILYFPFEFSKRKVGDFYIDQAIEVHVEKHEYLSPIDNRVYHIRNNKMIDRALELHVYWDGRKTKSGTYKARKYAIEQGKLVKNWCHPNNMI